MKILTVVGARPQFIKAAAVSKVLRETCEEKIIHTGQHYDKNMSEVFFDELNIPRPDFNLHIGSGGHGFQTGNMLINLEEIYLNEKPDMILVYGDTNSTLAGALCASKMLIPVAHVEAGLRSFNMAMPEEQNRILTDHISKYLFAPTETAMKNLKNEGLTNNTYNVGDVMFDAVKHFKEIAKEKSVLYKKLIDTKDNFILTTIHRAENTNSIQRLSNIIEALNESGEKIILPLHPRTQKYISEYGLKLSNNIEIIEPIGYLDMLGLEMLAKKIVTDSGGVQKEAYFMDKPCITMRDETEWVETVEQGWNTVVGTEKNKILDAIINFNPVNEKLNVFGDGKASEIISDILRR
ncbi:non-hydrolyzing UDP-N-acetylglucosamine 2-epimerase [Clostridium sp. 'White wine YQ']|uniref:non-hydrolyzing UDP-N-acetylglucosamine 2-epimerase n=1 Tax=Clostridium sp. 'White wine YQ' TaxID=3027474 RepID=UPI0023667158|nr:UDP-N-acetylglucosamine 2-epimerase (non-hydrolyzing) [Clostridium sp. 'White wine YQ']MDD7794977.1 UDP-N-acetylglucosamine 2-epimerase (non-hydrolyzing) [Clostridium sp. 'White wine YQ']